MPPLLSDDNLKAFNSVTCRATDAASSPSTRKSGPSREAATGVEEAVKVLADTNKAFVDTMPFLPENLQKKNAAVAAVQKRQIDLAEVHARLEACYRQLNDVEKLRESETARWKANYDYVTARVLFRMVHFYEYQYCAGKGSQRRLAARGQENSHRLQVGPQGGTER